MKHINDDGVQRITNASVGVGGLMFVDNQSRAWAGVAPNAFIRNLAHRETQIIALELLALCMTANWAQEELQGAAAILFVDNLSVACMIAKGLSLIHI